MFSHMIVGSTTTTPAVRCLLAQLTSSFSSNRTQLGTLKAKISKLKSELINGPGGKSAGSKDAGRGFDGAFILGCCGVGVLCSIFAVLCSCFMSGQQQTVPHTTALVACVIFLSTYLSIEKKCIHTYIQISHKVGRHSHWPRRLSFRGQVDATHLVDGDQK